MPFSAGPMAFGSTSIKNYFDTTTLHVPRIKYTLLTDKGAYSCSPGDNCHGTDNIPLRCAEVAAHFSSRIAASGNTPGFSCNTSVFHPDNLREIELYYHAETNAIHLNSSNGAGLKEYFITNIQGQTIYRETLAGGAQSRIIPFPDHLAPGTYCVCIAGVQGLQCIKVLR
jgi:hypothetical protein